MNNLVTEELIQANEYQKIGDYKLSAKIYQQFFNDNPDHPMRFKALFEVADNLYHDKKYDEAKKQYQFFLSYCADQQQITSEEKGWVDAYTKLAYSRLENIDNYR
ncbi:MAG: tetratricopeptide repeat protein [Butyrivibrio sp.]|nr:tetratricopeptide repeat protein [Butyrivibrio sp.]